MQIRVDIGIYFFNLLVFNLILWNFKPMQTWPDFYRVNMNEILVNANRRSLPKKPIMTFEIKNSDLLDSEPFN
jgi:hypothetical protein